MKYHATVKYNL